MAANAKNKKTKSNNSASKSNTSKRTKSTNRSTRAIQSERNQLIGDISLVVMIGLTVILYLADFGLCGKAGKVLVNLTFGLFGVMGYLSPLFVVLALCFILSNRNKLGIFFKALLVLGLIILTGSFFCLFSVTEINETVTWKQLYDFSMTGQAGGILGNAPVLFLCPKFGKAATFIILLVIWIILFLILTDFSVIDWVKIRVEAYKANADQIQEIREIKQETKQNKIEQKIEQKRQKNQEKMLNAMKYLEESRIQKAQALENESNIRLGREPKPERTPVSKPVTIKTTNTSSAATNPQTDISDDNNNGLEAVIPSETVTTSEKTKPVSGAFRRTAIRRSSAEERKLIPSFLLSDEAFERKNHKSDLDDEEKAENKIETESDFVPDYDENGYNAPEKTVIPGIKTLDNSAEENTAFEVEAKTEETGFVILPDNKDKDKGKITKEQILENELTNIHQLHIKDLDAPVRKPFPKTDEEDEKIIEMAGGRAITNNLGMGGTKKVEAEGTEKDPHGIGREYEPDEEEKIKAELEAATVKKVPEKKYKFPPTSLLKKKEGGVKNNREQLKETAERLQSVLQSFGVGARVTDVTSGPSVTRYELTPDTGVKVSKIVGLQDDIKLNLAAADIRIEAPIPGKAAVGIEVPNKEKSGVTLREMLESPEFRDHKSKLAFTVGKDIGGANVIGDIAKMPHLLIAGTTGSGKSVSVNTIIVSLLYHASPLEVKLLMIDPKVVELKVYNGIPHLLRPVITDVKQASGALNWAVTEMNRRYKLFAESNVRDLSGYNEKVKEQAIYGDIGGLKPLPQIVIIVDELADLMMSAPAEVEDSIQHIAQMGRASGMHLILITQRPTVNVVTGTIKANVPSRIALTVASGTDSRTMIDMVGAEKLLGNGDMLYFPVGMQKPIRLQGPYVGDEEINSIVDYLKNQGSVEGGGVDESVDKQIAETTSKKEAAEAKQEEDDKDDLLFDAGKFIIESDKASIGMLQRKFRIGFNRAARIMDTLAELGVVGPEEGTKPRSIIMNVVQFENMMKK